MQCTGGFGSKSGRSFVHCYIDLQDPTSKSKEKSIRQGMLYRIVSKYNRLPMIQGPVKS